MKSTPTTQRSKASSTEAEATPVDNPVAPAAEPGLSAFFPGYIRKLKGFIDVAESVDSARKKARLPSFNPTNYRFILGRPGGIPFSFPVQVIYKPGSSQEKDLGTYRVGR